VKWLNCNARGRQYKWPSELSLLLFAVPAQLCPSRLLRSRNRCASFGRQPAAWGSGVCLRRKGRRLSGTSRRLPARPCDAPPPALDRSSHLARGAGHSGKQVAGGIADLSQLPRDVLALVQPILGPVLCRAQEPAQVFRELIYRLCAWSTFSHTTNYAITREKMASTLMSSLQVGVTKISDDINYIFAVGNRQQSEGNVTRLNRLP
jgi:hypothetical protein